MPGGYVGRFLFVDLTRGELSWEEKGEEIYHHFFGGYGIGARVIYSRQARGVDPLSSESYLGFVTGLLTGLPGLISPRYTVVGKSPLTGTWGDANSGGFLGPRLKSAGADAIFFFGRSTTPVYLLLEDGKGRLVHASDLWGKDVRETEDTLKEKLGKQAEVASIGPAGEKRSLIANIMHRMRAAGRSGLGALMGSKNLKAVVALGDRKIPVHDEVKVNELSKKYQGMFGGPVAKSLQTFGTCGLTAVWTKSGEAPVKNWGGSYLDFQTVEKISDANVIKYQKRRDACYRCRIGCGGVVQVDEGRYSLEAKKPEYETLAAFGTMCLNENFASIVKAGDICDRSGMDTMSAGCTIAFAIECYENGIITKDDTGGIELQWGAHEAIVAMTEKMAKREGFGEVLADGVKVAAEKIGKGAEKFAIHIGGQEIGLHDPKNTPGYATSYLMDATPGRHTQGGAKSAEGLTPPGLRYQPHNKYVYEGKGETHLQLSSLMHTVNSLGLCLFGFLSIDVNTIPEILRAVTGWDISYDDLIFTGERIANLRHAFNLREGINPLTFNIPGRVIGWPPHQLGPVKGVRVDYESQVRDYLMAADWDPVTAKPSQKKLMDLGLEDIAADLYRNERR